MNYIVSENIKGLIFDFDGTIVDSMPVHLKSWTEAFEISGAKFDEDLFYEKAGVSLVGVVKFYNEKHGTDLDPQRVADLKNSLHVKHIPEIKLIDPVFNVIKSYYGKLPMAVATGNHRDVTLMAMEALDIKKYFKAVVSAEDVENPKPAPDCFLRAAELIEIEPPCCEVFEDGVPGLQGAATAAMKATDIREWL